MAGPIAACESTEVSILPADNLWGFDTMDTLEALEEVEGKGVRSLVIGPAGEERESALEEIRAIRRRLYGSADAADPYGGYRGKARLGHFHTVRPVILDCVPVDVYRFPLIYDGNAPDRLWRLNVDGIGEIEGPSVEYHLFRTGTGLDWPEEELERAAERVVTLERALQVRHWGRDRRLDESILPYFQRPEFSQSLYLEERYGLDREQFAPVVDEFYVLHGWDPQTGWPTRERLTELDIGDVYGPMVEGAARARGGSQDVY